MFTPCLVRITKVAPIPTVTEQSQGVAKSKSPHDKMPRYMLDVASRPSHDKPDPAKPVEITTEHWTSKRVSDVTKAERVLEDATNA